MVPYFEERHFLSPLALGMVPFLVSFFFAKFKISDYEIFYRIKYFSKNSKYPKCGYFIG